MVNKFSTKKNQYFLNLHTGYLFQITNNLFIGPQVGYSHYGSIKLQNKSDIIAPPAKGSGQANLLFNSFNFYAVVEYDIGHVFLQERIGVLYMLGTTSGDYQSSVVGPVEYIYKKIDAENSF